MTKLLFFLFMISVSAPNAGADVSESIRSEAVYRTTLGRADDVKLILEQGLSPNEKNAAGVPLLALAAARTDEEGLNVVKALVGAGANVNAQDAVGQTPLFYAAKAGIKNTVQYLLEQKVNYYAADNKGTIARTIAHQSGHEDIVTLMDDFVKGQSEKINQQYVELNNKLKEQYKEQLDAAQSAAASKSAEIAKQKVESSQQNVDNKAIEEARVQELLAKRDPEKLKQWVHDLAYNSCAFEYWYYCQSMKQSTVISEEELANTILEYKDKIRANGKAIMEAYQTNNKYTDSISKPSMQAIFNQLNRMPSRTYRHENGVGKEEDMKKRCMLIAREWDIVDVSNPVTPVISGEKPQRDSGMAPAKNASKANAKPKPHNAASNNSQDTAGAAGGARGGGNGNGNASRKSSVNPANDPLLVPYEMPRTQPP